MQSFNLPRFVRDTALAAGIPETHLSAIVERAERAKHAADKIDKATPLRGDGAGLVVVSSLDGIEGELATAERALARRVVLRAAADYEKGLLERFL